MYLSTTSYAQKMSNKNTILIINIFPDKKMKSLGNKGLIRLNNNTLLIDYHIKYFNNIFNKPDIYILGNFEFNKLDKHINKHQNVHHIMCDTNDESNIGGAILPILSKISNDSNVFITQSSILYFIKDKHKLNKNYSYVIGSVNDNSSNIGCIIEDNKIINCSYDLPNQIYDALFLYKKDITFINHILSNTKNIHKFFLFEILNTILEHSIPFKLNTLDNKNIAVLDNASKIPDIQKKVTKYEKSYFIKH